MKKIELQRPKTCSCGRMHFSIPETAKEINEGDFFDGYYWDCACTSTLFIPMQKLETFLEAA